jgi:hypothetical protein
VGIEFVPGVELSVESKKGPMHLLGLWLRDNPPILSKALDRLNEGRSERNALMAEKLRKLGMDISLAEIEDKAAGGTVGRPHMAMLLLEKGHVASVDDAFARFLGARGKAYVPKAKLSPEQALDILHREQATPILAHPYILNMRDHALADLLLELKDQGLEGIEAYYTEHGPNRTQRYLSLANQLGLVVAGGSDFHGDLKPGLRLGRGRGELYVPTKVLDDLKAHRAARGQWT